MLLDNSIINIDLEFLPSLRNSNLAGLNDIFVSLLSPL